LVLCFRLQEGGFLLGGLVLTGPQYPEPHTLRCLQQSAQFLVLETELQHLTSQICVVTLCVGLARTLTEASLGFMVLGSKTTSKVTPTRSRQLGFKLLAQTQESVQLTKFLDLHHLLPVLMVGLKPVPRTFPCYIASNTNESL
jgi:hypothetical protein